MYSIRLHDTGACGTLVRASRRCTSDYPVVQSTCEYGMLLLPRRFQEGRKLSRMEYVYHRGLPTAARATVSAAFLTASTFVASTTLTAATAGPLRRQRFALLRRRRDRMQATAERGHQLQLVWPIYHPFATVAAAANGPRLDTEL